MFEGRKATHFWVRALDLEREIEAVCKLITAKAERKTGAVPIVAEYQIDERLKCIYLIQAEVDALGIMNGVGFLYWASPEHEKEVLEIRDKQANDLLKIMHGYRGYDEIIPLEVKREK
jgi:hypothetical protein